MSKENDTVKLKLEKHLWQDELLEIERKRNRRIKIVISVLSLIIVFILGFLVGLSNPTPIAGTATDSESKLSKILDIMSHDWFFASEYENVEEHLLDNALYGMTKNEDVDLHTSYMSRSEVEAFTNSINMHFVGIGVQFFNAGDYSLVKKVFKDSPADKAGVLAGDIFNKVNGEDVRGKTSDELAALVRGEKGTEVVIEFLRQSNPITITITREEVNATSYGEMIDEKIGYLEMYQFGETTAREVESYLKSMSEQGLEKLIIDLRDNGGGYLDVLVNTLNLLLPKDTAVIQQVYPDGEVEFSKTTGGQFTNINEIVILINGNTASASEVMTLALKEQRSDVTIVGTKSYGKGTVQVTKSFVDGSAIKYTTSKWMSPNGVWVNKVGIEPDISVNLHDVFGVSFSQMNEEEIYKTDNVSDKIKAVQLGLQYLGYSIDRVDGYFSLHTSEALKDFQANEGLEITGVLNKKTYETVYSAVSKEWSLNKEKDAQYQKAVELLND